MANGGLPPLPLVLSPPVPPQMEPPPTHTMRNTLWGNLKSEAQSQDAHFLFEWEEDKTPFIGHLTECFAL